MKSESGGRDILNGILFAGFKREAGAEGARRSVAPLLKPPPFSHILSLGLLVTKPSVLESGPFGDGILCNIA